MNFPQRKSAPKITPALPTKPVVIPAGHTAAFAVSRVFGPKMKTDPSGHPIYLHSGVFDLNTTTPQEAIAAAARRWHGIEVNVDNWQITMEEDTIQPPTGLKNPRPRVAYQRFFYLVYLPEQAMWKHKGLHDDNVPNHFKGSHYLTQKWKEVKNK